MKELPVRIIVPLVFADIMCFALVLGATTWFFFVQSPQLIKFIGKEKFVPIQMKITGWYFFYIQIPLLVMVIVAMLLQHNYNEKGVWMFATAVVGAVAGLINKTFIVPRALSVEADSVTNYRKNTPGSVGGELGKGDNNFWQQAVIACVLLMSAGIVLHIWHLLQFLVAHLPAILDTAANK